MFLPTGTVTFFFTDIEGSTKLWEQYPQAMSTALARHDALMHQSIADQEGVVFKTMGDAFCAVFATAPQALLAAFTAQQELQIETWPEGVNLRVRMALHTGTADERDGDYFGPPLNRVARLLATGHGGQILLSQPTYELTRDALPPACSLQDMGSHALRDLARSEQVYQLCHPSLISEFPSLKSLDALPNNLPVQLTSFVGREKELSQIKELLAKARLLMLTGSGGCGKTRLSLQVAADVLDQYPDGVWLVELAPITDPTLVPQTVASVLGVAEQPGQPLTQTLADWLKPKQLLLLLDNCEHVLPACAALTDTLLRTCPQVKMLSSSREGLGIPGEQTYRVPSLSLAAPNLLLSPESLSQYEAVRLFIERAALVKPGFTVTSQNAPAVASVCHQVDGIPLAIELAAARLRSLSVEEVSTRLDNRFRLLIGGARTALPRQQTLRALIDWSYDLLNAQEKSLLQRLSIFAGGWTLVSAEAVCVGEDIEDWEVLDLLTSLADKSLVQLEETEGQTRYRLLETVRQYARDRLAEDDESNIVRERHRDYFLELAEEAALKLIGPEQAHWLSLLEREHDNLRQALTFCLEAPEDREKGLRLGAAMQHFWATRGYISEGRERLTALLSRPDGQVHTKARAGSLHGAGNLARMQGEYDLSRSLQEESLVIWRELGEMHGIASSLHNLGMVAQAKGDYDLSRSLQEESLALREGLGDKLGIATSLNSLGVVAYVQGDYAAARSQYEKGLEIQKELGNNRGIAIGFNNLGLIALAQGDLASALFRYKECLAWMRDLEDKPGIATSLDNLGTVAFIQNDFESARSQYRESLRLRRELGDMQGISSSLHNLGLIASAESDYTTALTLYQEALMINRKLGNRAWEAMTLTDLGLIAGKQDDYVLARSFFAESLRVKQELQDKNGIAISLGVFAALANEQGHVERAACLWGAAEVLREAIGSPLPLNERDGYEQNVEIAREMLGREAFQAAWTEGRALPWEQAVVYALEG